jgi:16S rRNA (guanine527-N7)-methyltransferase
MTEDEARAWLEGTLHVPRETCDRLSLFLSFLKEEALSQNLVARSTLETLWSRHVVDSAQLIPLASPAKGEWVDLGSGAGFPGLIVAAITGAQITLVEERRKRVEFLARAIDILGIAGTTSIFPGRAETIPAATFDVISARAFAPLEKLFAIAARLSRPETIWLLPKGRSAQAELDAARLTWQGVFRLEPSVTDPDSAILIARNVRPREQR